VPKAWLASGGVDRGAQAEDIERIFHTQRRRPGGSAAHKAAAAANRESSQDSDLPTPRDYSSLQDGHKYFIALNLYNSKDIIPDLFSTMIKVSSILGFQNVFVSVYENGSNDQTKALLHIFDSLAKAVGLRMVIRTSLRTRGAFNHRIEYLAEVRNAALAPLQELRDATGEVFDSIIFQNDVLPCVDDVLELIWQSRRQNAGITCGADYIYHEEINQPVFYDNWVSRDMNGTALENAPFESVFRDPDSSHRFMRHLPVQVQSCWNGIAILWVRWPWWTVLRRSQGIQLRCTPTHTSSFEWLDLATANAPRPSAR
jgi:alpha-1,3-mannosyltransferase